MTIEEPLIIATVGLVIATLALALVTLGLYWEARRVRVEANVVAYAAPWEMAGGLFVVIQIENAGPATATNVEVKWRLGREATTREGVLREPVFIAGFRRTILPDRTKMDDLAADGATIHIELEWRDGRWRTQHRTIATTCAAVKDDYTNSGGLLRPSQLEVLTQIRDALKDK